MDCDQHLPNTYAESLQGQTFLMNDSRPNDFDDNEEEEADEERVLVFASRCNIELLFEQNM